jgi:hypothetical protein
MLTAAISAADIATAGTASISVTNPGPGGGTSEVRYFAVTLSPQGLLFHLSNFATIHQGGVGGFTAGDFNRDGKLDVAVFQDLNSSSSLDILLGKGDGTFSSVVLIKVPKNSCCAVTGDFNGDGFLDLAFADGFSRVFVLLGNGDGTFKPLPSTKMSQGPSLVAVGDFNGDGKLDLVTSNGNNNSISILLGNGDGSFQPEIDIIGIPAPFFLAVGDFNRDGKLDIGVVEGGSGFTIFLGNGDGTFTRGNTYASPSAQSIAAADLNGDGNLDLVVVNGADGQQGDWEVFLGNGDGTFRGGVDYSPGGGFDSATVADINGDGKQDVIASGAFGTYANMLAVFLGNGDGTFQSPLTYATGKIPGFSATGDLNGDGRLDLIFESITPAAYMALIQVPAAFAPTSLSFGKVAIGSTSGSQSVVLTNEGGPALAISGVNVKGSDPGDFAPTNNCPSNLAAGANCSINVTFTPTAKGTRSAIVSVSFGGGAIPQGFTVKGTGQ